MRRFVAHFGIGSTKMAILYAFCCLGFAAVNDFVFKLYARKERSRGVFVFAVGIVYTLLVSLLPDWWGRSYLATLGWGLVCGIFSVVGNILLIESMSRLSAGMCSTVYRLNLLLVVPLALVFFKESLLWYQWIGIAAALLAVIAFMPVGEKVVAGRKSDYVMLILAMTMRAGLGLATKAASLDPAVSKNGIQIVIGWSWIVGGLIYYLIREFRPMPPARAFDRKTFGYGALSGIFVAGILVFMVKSLECGEASIVLPIQQMSFLATFFLGVIFLKEKIALRKIAALACGVVALLLLSYSKPKAADPAASVPAQPTTNEVQK